MVVGAAGLATGASLLERRPDVSVTVIEHADNHYYRAGFGRRNLQVGAGIPGDTGGYAVRALSTCRE
ncbi:hypothetical protein PUN4_1340003 [Paraburkholderia unamae]|nr:hypothetical protein PUN4_1340003 [Paraburkholderia unamae]